MTKQTKCGVAGRVSSASFSKFLQIVILSVVVFQVQSMARAQGNLIDLYKWSNDTTVGSDPNPNDYVHLDSSTSALFSGGYTDEGGGVSPTLKGTLDTVIGETYEISFTMQNQNSFDAFASVSFGTDTKNIQLPFICWDGGSRYSDTPVHIDYTVVATSTLTPMSFRSYLDPDGGASALHNLTVTELATTAVPENSTSCLLLYGGCLLLLAKSLRGLVQKHKVAVKRIRA